MRLTTKSFRLPKAGNSGAEYEDAFDFSALTGRFAIADGASESSFAGIWARLLVEEFVKRSPFDANHYLRLPEWISPIQREWNRAIEWDGLPWYALDKAQHGGHSTLTGLEFVSKRLWRALAIGDSCLLQVRDDNLLVTFPIKKSADFRLNPPLLASVPSKTNASRGVARYGCVQAEDRLFLATDALSCWFLSQFETGGQPWQTLLGLKDCSDFACLVADLRNRKAVRNDDMSLIIIQVYDCDSCPI